MEIKTKINLNVLISLQIIKNIKINFFNSNKDSTFVKEN